MERFEPAFRRIEQSRRSTAYVRGLLGNATRKNVEQMALGLGEKVRSQQYFVGQSPWEAEPVIGIHQQLVGETLGEEDGVALIDKSRAVLPETQLGRLSLSSQGKIGYSRFEPCAVILKVVNVPQKSNHPLRGFPFLVSACPS